MLSQRSLTQGQGVIWDCGLIWRLSWSWRIQFQGISFTLLPRCACCQQEASVPCHVATLGYFSVLSIWYMVLPYASHPSERLAKTEDSMLFMTYSWKWYTRTSASLFSLEASHKTSSHSEWGIRLYTLRRLSKNQWAYVKPFSFFLVWLGLIWVLVLVYMDHSNFKGPNNETFYPVLSSWSFRFCLTLFNGSRGMRLGLFDFIVLEGGGQTGFLQFPGSWMGSFPS